MTHTDPDSRSYVQAVLDAYLSLPDTPRRPRPDDRFIAAELRRKRIPLSLIHAAFLLAMARRLFRDHEQEGPLQSIHSLRYFLPVIDEIRLDPLPPGYTNYLRTKLASHLVLKTPPANPCATPVAPAATSRKPRQLSFRW